MKHNTNQTTKHHKTNQTQTNKQQQPQNQDTTSRPFPFTTKGDIKAKTGETS